VTWCIGAEDLKCDTSIKQKFTNARALSDRNEAIPCVSNILKRVELGRQHARNVEVTCFPKFMAT